MLISRTQLCAAGHGGKWCAESGEIRWCGDVQRLAHYMVIGTVLFEISYRWQRLTGNAKIPTSAKEVMFSSASDSLIGC